MVDTNGASGSRVLTDRRVLSLPAIPDLVRKAAAKAQVGPGKIFREIIGLAFRRQGITQREYFGNHLYRRDLTAEQKREFIGEVGNTALNNRMSPPMLTQMRGFLNDKVTITALWKGFGLPTTTTRAVFTADRWLGPIRTLRDADQIMDYLCKETGFPIFGKPIRGLQAWGSVRIDGVDAAAGTAVLGNGTVVKLRDLVDEIVSGFPDGYMFQDAVIQHPEITGIFGPGLSCMRFVTVVTDKAPEIFYTYWKIAAPDAMSDNFWQPGSLLADVDRATGEITYCVTGKGTEEVEVIDHPTSGKQVKGYMVPFWQEACDLVLKAHAIYPINGCLGWDVAFTADGPVLIECNDNTGHNTYQIVTRKGMKSPEYKSVTDKVIAHSEAVAAEIKARAYKIEH